MHRHMLCADSIPNKNWKGHDEKAVRMEKTSHFSGFYGKMSGRSRFSVMKHTSGETTKAKAPEGMFQKV